MRVGLLLLETLLHFGCIYLILDKMYIRKQGFKIKLLLNISVRAVMLITSLCFDIDSVVLFSVLAIPLDIFTLSFGFEKCKIRNVLAVYILMDSLYTIISSLITFLTNVYNETHVTDFIGLASSLLIFCAVMLVINVKTDIFNSVSMIPRSIKLIVTLSVLSSAGAISFLLNGRAFGSLSDWKVEAKILVVLFILIIGSVFPALIVNSIGKTYYNKQAIMAEKQLELQARHYEEIAKNNFEVRRFKHDFKNLLLGLLELIRKGDINGAIELLRKGTGIVTEGACQSFETGNGIVDTILSEKQKEADGINAVIIFEGYVPSEKIAPTDLCVIFGNTIDNAIEACQKIHTDEQSVISVSCKSAGGFVFVNINNPVAQDVIISKNIIKTTKDNKSEHGFGIYSLKKAVDKYNGTMELSCTNNIFTVDLELEIS